MLRANLNIDETIFARASGALPSAVAVYKISGNKSFEIASRFFVPESGNFEKRRGMHFGTLYDLEKKFLDSVLMLQFVAPHSHTGEDVIEIHCHGSRAIARKLESCLISLGARQAQPGEFSYRAFANEKLGAEELDLLGDVFQANTVADLDALYSRREGAFLQKIDRLRDKVLTLQAILDTAVDFSDEYSEVVRGARAPLQEIIRECSEIIQRYSAFRGVGSSQRIVIVGQANAGKSSLFNLLLSRYRAIVHSDPGTTRDAIEEDIELFGKLMKLVDTAGVRFPSSDPEKIGISIGEDFLKSAAGWVLVVDGNKGIGEPERGLIDKYGSKPFVVVLNKSDLDQRPVPADIEKLKPIQVSALNDRGVPQLLERMKESFMGFPDLPIPSDQQAAHLQVALDRLIEMNEAMDKLNPEILAESSRSVIRLLEGLVGTVDPEQVLDKVFSSFCIGK